MSSRYLAVVLLLAVTLGASKWSWGRHPDLLNRPLSSLPLSVSGWTGANTNEVSDSVASKLRATEYLTRVYLRDGHSIGLLISYYAEQRAGETMHSPQACLPGAGWEPWDYSTKEITVGTDRITVNRYAVQKDGLRMQVLYWYQSKRRIIASEYYSKALLIWDSILGRSTGAALVRLTTDDREGAITDLSSFATAIIPEIRQPLGN